MAQQTINVGASANDGTGTPLRTAFQFTNSNFSELYSAIDNGFAIPRLTTAQRNALTPGVGDKGKMVYDTTLTTLCLWNGTAWEFVSDNSNGIVSVKDFGAKGDGVTDDAAAIQAAVNFVYSNGGGIVFVPVGTYSISTWIKLNSYVTLQGEGFESKIVSTAFRAILADRDDAPNAATPYVNIVVSDLYVESQWNGPTPSHVYPCVELEFCNDCRIENIFVGKADDACIRVSGYRKGIVNFTPSFTNPDFGWAKRNVICNCSVQQGYLGIELVGGAQCDILNNTVIDSYYHAIRLAGGGWFCSVTGNKVMTCQHSAFYAQFSQNVTIADNPYLRSDRLAVATGISYGDSKNLVIDSNVVYGIVSDAVLAGSSDAVVVSNNYITEYALFNFTTNVKVIGNHVIGKGEISLNASGELNDNLVGTIGFQASKMVQNGGDVNYRNNVLLSSKLPATPSVQASIIGTASATPAAGTFRLGDIILKANATDYVGWICTVAGTPGTWNPFGQIGSVYARQVSGRQDGVNATKTLLSFTVPNNTHAIRLIVYLLLSRAPASSPGQSRVIRNEIIVSRNTGSSCVIDTALATGNYEVLTTTAGGANTPSASSLTAVIASGAATDPQVINVTSFFGPALEYGAYTIDIQSTSPLSTFGL
jgi:parallel beta-helix repeat protein